MLGRFARIAALTSVLGLAAAPAAQAGAHVSVQVGIGVPVVVGPPAPVVVAPAPPVVVAPPPPPVYVYAAPVWVPVYYVGYRWVPGYWARPYPYHARGWAHERYEHGYRGWRR